MDYCRSCGSEVADGTRQCPRCGAVVDEFAPVTEVAADDQLHREIRALASREGVIAAIKRYREATGCDLTTAKGAVDRLVAGGAPVAEVPAASSIESAVLEIAEREGKIPAIKRYRTETNCGLKEAKEAVETLLREHGVQPRSGSGCAGVLLLLLLLIGLGLQLPF